MPASKQETQRQCILHLWNEGICNGQEINRRTNIPLSTIYDNIKKIKEKGTCEAMVVPGGQSDSQYGEMTQYPHGL